ncbi:MAG: bifunctional hydroxymethylpyrimidine kinase/phosphomethylpyrimidine kinase [bacterium]
MKYRVALTIAGSDSGGGAGIQGDLKTFSAHGVYGASVITAITAQNTLGVSGIQYISPDMVGAQIDAVMSDLPVHAVKIGMLGNVDIVKVVAEKMRKYKPPSIVLDTVMLAKSGDALLKKNAVKALITELIPLATLITPNLPEAAEILGEEITDPAEATRKLLHLGAKAVLLKGGHGVGDMLYDYLMVRGGQLQEFSNPRINTRNTHGTGCTLSSAVAAHLALDDSLDDAVSESIAWLHQAIKKTYSIGSGHSPVNHFWQYWRADND